MIYFNNKVVLITGAASGIGRAMAHAFAVQGARLALADVDQNGLQETVDHVKDMGNEAIAIAADVSKAKDVKHMVDVTVDHYGHLDVACNNAGIEGQQAPTAECTEENWDRVIDINLKGVWLCMKYEIPQMVEEGGGAIVNTASVAGLVGFGNIAAYVASKHGINGLTKTAALEYATQGLRVNSICPGAIETPMIDRFTQGSEEAREQFHAMHPLGRMGKPEEVAAAAIWLCSEEASFITGHAMPVDGGFTCQ